MQECNFITFTFNNLADAFIQSNLKMMVIKAIKTTKEQKNMCCPCKSNAVARPDFAELDVFLGQHILVDHM